MKYNGEPNFRSRVKICGLTSLADAWAAIEAGADALGFNFYKKSPRYIAPEKAAAILRALPPMVGVVGVFVDPGLEFMQGVIGRCRLDHFQMNGDESEEFLGNFPKDKLIRGLRLADRRGLKKLPRLSHAGAFLLDAFAPGLKGGTGKTLDWSLAAQARRILKKPVILAGGLNEHNVAQAIRTVAPFAVDVCSGVETRPGRKDAGKMRRFVKAAKNVVLKKI